VNRDSLFASIVLGVHVAFILWIVFGAVWTRCRPLLRWLHIGCLVWGVVVEVGPWPCPLTVAENRLEVLAGVAPFTGGFMLHYLDRIVYPAISPGLLMAAGLLILAFNFAIYIRRFRQRHANHCW